MSRQLANQWNNSVPGEVVFLLPSILRKVVCSAYYAHQRRKEDPVMVIKMEWVLGHSCTTVLSAWLGISVDHAPDTDNVSVAWDPTTIRLGCNPWRTKRDSLVPVAMAQQRRYLSPPIHEPRVASPQQTKLNLSNALIQKLFLYSFATTTNGRRK